MALQKLNLLQWVKTNQKHLKPPVSNKQLFTGSDDLILFVSGGPNTRNDFHVNPTEELFYQLKGDIALRIRPLDDSKPRDVIIREGEMFLLSRWVPHRPQRPADTVGLIVEFPRGVDSEGRPQEDALRWYCPKCDALVHEARWVLKKIDEDLKIIMEDFWEGPEARRTCQECGTVIQRARAFNMAAPKTTKRAKGTSQSRRTARPRKAGKVVRRGADPSRTR